VQSVHAALSTLRRPWALVICTRKSEVLHRDEEIGSIKQTHLEMPADFSTKEIRANWTTIGLGFGMVLEYALIESQAPPWSGFIFFALVAGLVQRLLRWDWRFVRTLAEKILPAAKTNPTD
jgi:hypothetical protein